MANTTLKLIKLLVDMTSEQENQLTIVYTSTEPNHPFWGGGVKQQSFPVGEESILKLIERVTTFKEYMHWPDADVETTAFLWRGQDVNIPLANLIDIQEYAAFQKDNIGVCGCGVPYVQHGTACGWANAAFNYFDKNATPTAEDKRQQAIQMGRVSAKGSRGHKFIFASIAAQEARPQIQPGS